MQPEINLVQMTLWMSVISYILNAYSANALSSRVAPDGGQTWVIIPVKNSWAANIPACF